MSNAGLSLDCKSTISVLPDAFKTSANAVLNLIT